MDLEEGSQQLPCRATEVEKMHITAYEQRDGAYLHRNSLQVLNGADIAQSAGSARVSQASPSSASHQRPQLAETLSPAEAEDATWRTSTSEAAAPALPLMTPASTSPGAVASSSSRLSRSAAGPADLGRRVWIGPRAKNVAAHTPEPADEEGRTCCEVLDMFEDDVLPGYQVQRRGEPGSGALAVRVPRQLMGWKAVLMDPSGFDDAQVALSKKARRASKVLGKQGWEVRQEALKNSYDFRRGSGIWATMHAGHRLFKHDWHIIVKDGSRYMWRMDKHALALYREEDDVKLGEFCKAVPSNSGGVGTDDRAGKRIGSFRFHGQRSRIRAGYVPDGATFGLNLALASLIAVFGARGGHENVSAAFEPSSDPRRDVLEQQRQEALDREQVMLALPRPGFARDAESVLSDTTDEEAGEPASDTLRPPRLTTTQQSTLAQTPQTDSAGFGSKRRKRFSSFFGRASAQAVMEEQDSSITDSQRIARQYHQRQSMQ
ncbi:hypothetical protein EX895_005959 [Sporisorium graminicola]|uniref:Uncharacterized protein n=1 Tax=Sporisorium graminicola TaxID=280036 RepID=A0A4V6ETF0_9BASI|nr:hypothetical protein EX895_005959 [Sporisorium graminicola]TKY84879.1 hypothetical protein EX895_005959 [Sporisorium graminicola]